MRGEGGVKIESELLLRVLYLSSHIVTYGGKHQAIA